MAAYGSTSTSEGGDLPSDHEDRADLDVLQEIYASSDGFQDADGNDIAVKASGFFRGGTAIERPRASGGQRLPQCVDS